MRTSEVDLVEAAALESNAGQLRRAQGREVDPAVRERHVLEDRRRQCRARHSDARERDAPQLHFLNPQVRPAAPRHDGVPNQHPGDRGAAEIGLDQPALIEPCLGRDLAREIGPFQPGAFERQPIQRQPGRGRLQLGRNVGRIRVLERLGRQVETLQVR